MSLVDVDPYIAITLAVERRAGFMAEATHARRLAQLPSGLHEPRALRFVLAIRDSSRWGAARSTSWGALDWRREVSMAGDG